MCREISRVERRRLYNCRWLSIRRGLVSYLYANGSVGILNFMSQKFVAKTLYITPYTHVHCPKLKTQHSSRTDCIPVPYHSPPFQLSQLPALTEINKAPTYNSCKPSRPTPSSIPTLSPNLDSRINRQQTPPPGILNISTLRIRRHQPMLIRIINIKIPISIIATKVIPRMHA